MQIELIAQGQLKERWLKEGVEEYRKRLSRYFDFKITELKDFPDSWPEMKAKEEEMAQILKHLRPRTCLVLMDERGEMMDSVAFSEHLYRWLERGFSHLTLVIGSSRGLHPELKKRADALVSFGKMTMPHTLFRLVLAEQLFRAAKIRAGESYHK